MSLFKTGPNDLLKVIHILQLKLTHKKCTSNYSKVIQLNLKASQDIIFEDTISEIISQLYTISGE